MLIPLPDLDDRRWADLVEESRALIPVHAPEWTDHNLSDPGVTLIELFAWFAEMDIYRVNQIPAAAWRRFLALVGVKPQAAKAARTVLRLGIDEAGLPLDLPSDSEFDGLDPSGARTRFRTLEPLTVIAGELRAAWSVAGQHIEDLTTRRDRGEPLTPFGSDPGPGAAIYLGFSRPLPVGVEVSLFFSLDGPAVGTDERARISAEQAPRADCVPAKPVCDCDAMDAPAAFATDATAATATVEAEPVLLEHHSVRLAWEYRSSPGAWQTLVAADGEVRDETRSLTLSGRVVLRLPDQMGRGADEDVDPSLFYVRCRLVDGAYEAAPRIGDVSLNAVAAEQAVSPDISDARATVAPPGQGAVGDLLGIGSGRPFQELTTSDEQVVEEGLVVQTIEGNGPHVWQRRPDFDSSARGDRHFLLDAALGRIRFGDGEHGRTVADGVPIIASYRVTRAEAGNLAAGMVGALAPTRHNRAAFAFDQAVAALTAISNVTPAVGGTAAESVAHASGRALELVSRATRAVTLADFETLARETPGARVARASAIAGLHPAFPCVDASGVVSVLVIPTLPTDRPLPSPGLRRAVRTYLSRRRLIGTRVEVLEPTYTEVAVRATVTARPDEQPVAVEGRVGAALRRFFSPIEGGPDGTGWPFGRDVYRTEVMHVIKGVDGIVRADSVELSGGGCGWGCSNVCVGPTGLVLSGQHQITVR